MPSSKRPAFPSSGLDSRLSPRWGTLAAVLTGLCILAFLPAVRAAESVSIAAAADLAYCLGDINAAFKKTHPAADLKVSSGSSGNFTAQIKTGAPFEVFLSADMSYPKELVQKGFADEKTLFTYAFGKIVLWTLHPETVDVTRGLAVLSDADVVRKLAVANPDHAPYGRAAKEALQHEKLWDALQSRIVLGENIAQTAQFVVSGNVDAGIVALSLVTSPKLASTGKWQEIPAEDYAPLEQGAVLTKVGAGNPTARAYMDFLRTPEARAIFDHYGFRLPEKKG